MKRPPETVAAEFLNLDLELRSKTDLAPLASHLERHVHVLFSGEEEGEFLFTAEPRSGGRAGQTPEKCTEDLLTMLSALSAKQRRVLEACHVRLFDYGFDGGLEARSLSVDLPSSQLARMASLGIDLRITVYPYRAAPPIQVDD